MAVAVGAIIAIDEATMTMITMTEIIDTDKESTRGACAQSAALLGRL